MIIAIAAGGAIGALGRHWISQAIAQWLGHGFPYGTLGVNIMGSFVLGLLVSLFAEKFALNQEVRGFIVVGLLGGFTTFSAFSLEAVLLIERGQIGLAALYVAGSATLGVAVLIAGIHFARWAF
jgi:CrcB protein